MSQSETEREWEKRLRAFERSGKTVKEFCDAGGFSDASFYKWRQRLAGVAGASSVSVELVEVGASRESSLEIVVGEVVVRVPCGFDSEALGRVLDVLAKRA